MRNIETSRLLLLAAAAGTALAVGPEASGINGPNAIKIVTGSDLDKEFWYVGRVQYPTNAVDKHNGSGSYIARGVALTAAHVLNSDSPTGQNFERFQLGATRFLGLGVQKPGYDPTGGASHPHDIGLLLVLNGRDKAGAEAFPTLAAAGGADVLTKGNTVQVLGFSTAVANESVKSIGTMKFPDPLVNGNVTNELYTFNRPPSSELTNGGDSGGPNVFDFGGGGGGKKIVAVNNSGNNVFSSSTRVDTYRGFVDGGGFNDERVLDRFKPGANPVWSNTDRWGRGGAGAGEVPKTHDVVTLDPTAGDDTGTTFTVDVDTQNLDGLLNGITLDVKTKQLLVDNKSDKTPGTGALNGGVIRVGGGADGTAGQFVVGWTIENAGTLDVKGRGTMTVGASLPADSPQVALYNSLTDAGRGVVNVASTAAADATLDVARAMSNEGGLVVGARGKVRVGSGYGAGDSSVRLTNKSPTAGTPATIEVTGAGALLENRSATSNVGSISVGTGGTITLGTGSSEDTTVLGNGLALNPPAGVVFNVMPGGTLTATDGVNKKSGVFMNHAGAALSVVGGADNAGGASSATIDRLDTAGPVQVGPRATLTLNRDLRMRAGATFSVAGGAAGASLAKVGSVVNNDATAEKPTMITVGGGGRLEAERTPGTLSVDAVEMLASKATLDVKAGGMVKIAGGVSMGGTWKVAADANGTGRVEVTGAADAPGRLRNIGNMTFTGAVNKRPEVVLNNALWNNDSAFASISGPAAISLSGTTAWFDSSKNANAPNANYNTLALVLDGAGTADSPTQVESMSKNNSAADVGNMAVLTQAFAWGELCLKNTSFGKLIDFSNNEATAGTEVLYVRTFGVDATSKLKLNGVKLYFLKVDAMCGLTKANIDGEFGKDYFQIPAPSAFGLLALAGVAAAGRRR
ncbi:MAG: hypothetical protein ACKVS8_11515 [Phycisphaerales bacterium]